MNVHVNPSSCEISTDVPVFVEGLEEVTSLDVITSEDEVEGGTTIDPSPKILFTHSG